MFSRAGSRRAALGVGPARFAPAQRPVAPFALGRVFQPPRRRCTLSRSRDVGRRRGRSRTAGISRFFMPPGVTIVIPVVRKGTFSTRDAPTLGLAQRGAPRLAQIIVLILVLPTPTL